MQKRNDETTIIHTAALATYTPPDVSQPTMPVAVLDGPTPPEWSGEGDDPATSFTPGMTESLRLARHARETTRMRHTLIIGGVLAIILAAIMIPVLHSAANAQQSALSRYAAQYTGWVSTDPATPIAVTVLPCQHDGACTDVAVNLTIQDAPGMGFDPHVYRLGGHLLNDHELHVWGTYGGVTYDLDIVMDHPMQGDITTGTARMILKRGGTSGTYQMRSATSEEQSTATKAK